jgi:hypothetical protein
MRKIPMKRMSSTTDFAELVHSAMRKQGRGHSVGHAALELGCADRITAR